MPLVSVILTSYNHEKYLRESIDSILNQTFTDFELYIIDDCSTDSSWDIICSYDDSRIKKIRHEKNMYYPYGQDFIDKLKGKYYALHHSDDAWEPDKLQKQVEYMEAHPGIAACFTRVSFMDEESKIYEPEKGNTYFGTFDKENRSRFEWLHYFFFNGNCLCHPSMMIRKEITGKYDLLTHMGLFQLPDFYLWVRLCRHEDIHVMPERLVRFRLRRAAQDNVSSDRPDVQIRDSFETYILLREFEKITETDDFIEVFPEARKYIVDGKINKRYAFAMLLRHLPGRMRKLYALEMLFDLIREPRSADEIKSLYGYTYLDFMRDSGEVDLFGVMSSGRFLETSLYMDEGDGFTEQDCQKREVYIRSDGAFEVAYDIPDGAKVKKLRFDPNEESIAIRLDKVMLDGEAVSAEPVQPYVMRGGYDVFFSDDPCYMIELARDGVRRVKISGFATRTVNLWKEIIDDYQNLRKELETVLSSRSWRITKPMRDTVNFMRCIKRSAAESMRFSDERDYSWVRIPGLVDSLCLKESVDRSLRVPLGFEHDEPQMRVAVIMHIFYTEIAGEMLKCANNVPCGADIYISTTSDDKRAEIKRIFSSYKKGGVEIRVFPNRGRDIAPTFIGFRDIYDKYDACVHIHSKKSPHEASKLREWRDYLYDNLLGSGGVVSSILHILSCPDAGVVFPQYFYPMREAVNWGRNFDVTRDFLRRFDIELDNHMLVEFPAGSMFWFKPDAIRQMWDNGMTFDDFPAESGQIDGTLAHAFERAALYLAEKNGYRWVKTSTADDKNSKSIILDSRSAEELAQNIEAVHRSVLEIHDV